MLTTTLRNELINLISTEFNIDNKNNEIKSLIINQIKNEIKINQNLRSFDDFEIIDNDNHYKIDINIYDMNRSISFPSLLSIQRAKSFLLNKNNHIIYIFVGYKTTDYKSSIYTIDVQNIEALDWKYLSIQNLGKGQIQMKTISPEKLIFNDKMSRTEWLNILNKKGDEYYDKLILKITEYKTNWNNELGN